MRIHVGELMRRQIGKLPGICLSFLLLGVSPEMAWATAVPSQTVKLSTQNGEIPVELYPAPGTDRHPAVLILHGRQGLDPLRLHYQRFARALAGSGIDTYLLSYYSGNDAQLANSPSAEQRQAFFASRVREWSRLISAVAAEILAGERSSGKIGLLGFSQGGFLATAVAGQDTQIGALGVFYGGIPNAVRSELSKLPPLLELHGDADRTVPLAEGKALVKFAKGLGQSAEMVVYPGAGHGFYGADDLDSMQRVSLFFRQNLQ